jgi:hypothetical protein
MAMRKNPKTGVWEEVDEQKNEYAERFARGARGEEPEDENEYKYNPDGSLKKKSTWGKLKAYLGKS